MDLDQEYQIDCIKEIKYDAESRTFFLLANKRKERLGFFLIRIQENSPTTDYQYLTLWRHKLDIGDANINILRGRDQTTGKGYKELVVSYKTIYINTYNVLV